jgi:multidrug resistance efflux pump
MYRFLMVALPIGAALLSVSVQSYRPVAPPSRLVSGPEPLPRIYAAGRVEGMTREVEIHATVSERVVSRRVKEGDFVIAGQCLIELDGATLLAEERLAIAGLQLAQSKRERLENGARQSEIDEARSMYDARVAEHDGAKQTLARVHRLRGGGAASAQMIEDAEVLVLSSQSMMRAAAARLRTLQSPPRQDDVAAAEAEIAVAAARLEFARSMLAKATIVAPTSGRVLQINVETGELPRGDLPVVVMCDTSQLKIRADVDELDALQVTQGQAAVITSDGIADTTIIGRVAQLRPRLTNKKMHTDRPGERIDSRVREVWIDLVDPPEMVVGLPVDVWITPNRRASPAIREPMELEPVEHAAARPETGHRR